MEIATKSAPFVAYHDVECVYPVSGNYGLTPRILFYFLLIFVVTSHRHKWLSAGAAASCLSTGGTAAIHALLLAAIRGSSTPQLSDGWVSPGGSNEVRVAPRVLDQDVDATLAIVGVGFLGAFPLAVSTNALPKPGSHAIVMMWAFLMLVGVFSCIANLFAVDESTTGPFMQYRFCPVGINDTLPLTGSPPPALTNTWNESVWLFFESTAPTSLGPHCFYPCLASYQPLRSQSDIQIQIFPDIQSQGTSYTIYYGGSMLIYGIFPLTVISGLALFFGQAFRLLPGPNSPEFSGFLSLRNNFSNLGTSGKKGILITTLQIYALVVTPFLLIIFIVLVEWTLAMDIASEDIQHVGQWSTVLGTGLVFLAVMLTEAWRLVHFIRSLVAEIAVIVLLWSFSLRR